jgi:cytochrome c oxidase subunit 2
MHGWWFVALLWMTAAMTPPVQTNIQPHDARTFTIAARRFTYSVSPQPFTVNQGDVVTLVLSAADDGAGTGHGFRLRTYADSSIILTPGAEPVTVTFTAHTPGQFIFFCTRFCGSGHSGMDGVFTVLGPAPLAVDEVSPPAGRPAEARPSPSAAPALRPARR